MEEAAYTWFNRFIAIKYMQEHLLAARSAACAPGQPRQLLPQVLREAQDVSLPERESRPRCWPLLDAEPNGRALQAVC